MGEHVNPGRGWLSRIDTMPEDIKVGINHDLREKVLTQEQILEKWNWEIADRCLPLLSRSSLNRYAKRVEAMGAMMRDAHEATKALLGGLGEYRGSDLGRGVTELVKTLNFHVIQRIQEDVDNGDPIDVDTLNKIALIAQRIERASKISLDREKAIRDEAMEKAAEAAEETAKRQGASAATIDKLREAIMSEISS